MVGEVLAGLGMREDREPVAVESEELRNVAERIARHGQLDASARVGADRPQVEMTDGNRKARLDRGGKLPGALDLLRIVIDVRVEIVDRFFGHAAAYQIRARFAGGM